MRRRKSKRCLSRAGRDTDDPGNIRLTYQHTRARYAAHCERDNTPIIEVTEEMINAGAAEVAAHGPEDSAQVTAWMVFEAMAKLAGFAVKEI